VGVLSAVTMREYAYQVVLAPFSMAGIAACVAAFRWLDERGRSPRPLAAIGRSSIVYYVSHFPVMVGTWLAGVALGVDDVLVLAVVGLVAALLVGAGLARARSTAPVRWLFESPRTPTTWVEERLNRLVGHRTAPGATRVGPASRD
jgi:peptidoglycan/LPS O-acetylase OafA/YrhL